VGRNLASLVVLCYAELLHQKPARTQMHADILCDHGPCKDISGKINSQISCMVFKASKICSKLLLASVNFIPHYTNQQVALCLHWTIKFGSLDQGPGTHNAFQFARDETACQFCCY
jgi:hypothetical protein